MEAHTGAQETRKRRRKQRRRLDKPAISAHLLLDDRLQGEVGVISPDLFADLFRGYEAAGMFCEWVLGSWGWS